jgi:hypothetical protein
MARKIIVGVVIVLLCVGAWWYYTRYTNHGNLGSGDVFSSDATPSKDTMDGATDLDGKPLGTVGPTPSRSDTPGTVNTAPVAGSTTNQAPAAKTPFTPAPTVTPGSTAGLPVTDSQSPNAPNDLHFVGSGKFQWYRQGNLTWRVNTESGSTCIAFATMEEWNKPIVYSHGCGNI